MNKKQAEFWVALIVLCIVFSIAILLVDFGIKASILEQSNRIRLEMEEWEVRISGRKSAGANEVRANNDAPDDPSIPSDVLVVNTPGMETGNGSTGDTTKTDNTRSNRAKSSRPSRARTIPNGDK